MVTPGPADGRNRVSTLFRFRASLHRGSRNFTGYCRRGLAGPHDLQQKGGDSPDGPGSTHRLVFLLDRSLVVAFSGTAHQHRQDSIHLRGIPFLSNAGNRYQANSGAIGRRDALVGGSRHRLQHF